MASTDELENETLRTVLVVEDDFDAQQLLAQLVERRGFEVERRNNGVDALAYLHAAAPPALILVDLHMPVMDGYELCAKLDADLALAHIPVVVMTDDRTADRSRLGTRVLLAKPLRVQQVVALLDEHVPGRTNVRSRPDDELS